MALLFVAVLTLSAPDGESPHPIDRLSWLIGEWTFSDEAQPEAGFAYRETGVRRCDWSPDRSYIRCESQGRSGDVERTYAFEFRAPHGSDAVEMISSHGDSRTVSRGGIEADGRVVRLMSDPYVERGQTRRRWAVIRYDGDRTWVWETGAGAVGTPDAEPGGPVKFRDTAVRRL